MTSNADETGFGYDPIEHTLSFVLNIPRDEEASVRLLDHRGVGKGDAGAGQLYASIPQSHWNLVESRLRVYFNDRLRSVDRPPGIWRFGANRLSEELGRELAVLLWGLEPVEAEQVSRVYTNWRRLAPEERQWLYGRVAKAPPQTDPDIGWRRAVQIALLEEPAPGPAQQRVNPADEPTATSLPPVRDSASTRRRKNLERSGQLRLL